MKIAITILFNWDFTELSPRLKMLQAANINIRETSKVWGTKKSHIDPNYKENLDFFFVLFWKIETRYFYD